MLDSDFLPLPSFRPNGRLDRLNYGGGNKGNKIDANAWVKDMKAYRKETGQNPAQGGAAGYGAFHKWQQGQGGGGGASVAASNAKPPQQVVSPEATAASATAAPMYTEKKKRRTLLSGQQALNQNNDGSTILGAS
jgi:hypothetical protein